jgi:uncharacterized MAPEG superfamily protein
VKVELAYLAGSVILTGSLWIPVVVGYTLTRGLPTREDYRRAPTRPLPVWVRRANRARLNTVECFAPFAADVLATAIRQAGAERFSAGFHLRVDGSSSRPRTAQGRGVAQLRLAAPHAVPSAG